MISKAAAVALFLAFSMAAAAQDADVQVRLDVAQAGPRAVESLTAQRILENYRLACSSMAHALEFNTVDPLDASFTGQAKQVLRATMLAQQKSGMSQRLTGQSHKLEAVFYAPEGDVIELHDTAEYQLQILDGGKAIGDQHVVMHYVVLMTPGADRWVVRQMQSVPAF